MIKVDCFCSEKSMNSVSMGSEGSVRAKASIRVRFKQIVPDKATSMPVMEDYSSLAFNLPSAEADKFQIGKRYKITIG